MARRVCVHGHFYQPPRENPWLETVERQDSAYPFHDWNERIAAECYEPNANARILDDDGWVERLVDNYARISFDVGPTLLSWMQATRPELHAALVAADAASAERFSGHGSAMAQAYHHIILPLANRRDRITQVRWGIRDFEHRFGRSPEGMWLPETAVDTDTLEVLAAAGITFTVLAPSQARRARPVGSRTWEDVTGGGLDTRVPYRIPLPSGRSLVAFFYDGGLARQVAFEGLLSSGEAFAGRLLDGFDGRGGLQLVHVATDGESYGHHHRYGEMALAYALRAIEAAPDVRLSNYAEVLERHPPVHEAQIIEGSSWSCAHGVERWRDDCGCTTGTSGGDQAWRRPLRESLDWLRDQLVPRFEDAGSTLFTDPWKARDDYIAVVLDRSASTVQRFLDRHARRPLDTAERVTALRLLELQRHAMLMYTSCGWFFGDLARIETVQVVRYAARVIQLAGELFDSSRLEDGFVERLAKAESCDPSVGDGRRLYETAVQPGVITLDQVAAHHAMSSLFDASAQSNRVHCYEIVRHRRELDEAGRARLLLASFEVRSTITAETAGFEASVLYVGDHNLVCGVRSAGSGDPFDEVRDDLRAGFATVDLPGTVRRLDAHFGQRRYSLRTMFRDERLRVLRRIMDSAMGETEATYRSIYRARAPLMLFLDELGITQPPALRHAAEVVVNGELREALASGAPDTERVAALLHRAERWDLELDRAGLAHELDMALVDGLRRVTEYLAAGRLFHRFTDEHEELLQGAADLVELVRTAPLEVDLSHAQNLLWHTARAYGEELWQRADAGDREAARWRGWLERLGTALRVRVS